MNGELAFSLAKMPGANFLSYTVLKNMPKFDFCYFGQECMANLQLHGYI
jgi:hypothetical protein